MRCTAPMKAPRPPPTIPSRNCRVALTPAVTWQLPTVSSSFQTQHFLVRLIVHTRGSEIVKGAAVALALSQYGDPAQPCLRAFENEQLEQSSIIVERLVAALPAPITTAFVPAPSKVLRADLILAVKDRGRRPRSRGHVVDHGPPAKPTYSASETAMRCGRTYTSD